MNRATGPFPGNLVLEPISRWPTTLPEATSRSVLDAAVDQQVRPAIAGDRPAVSVVMVTFGGLLFTRLSIESLLADTSGIEFEVVVVDNGSADGTVDYLEAVARLDARLRVNALGRNAGFSAATNLGVAMSKGDLLVLLNNDTIVTGPWLRNIVRHLSDTTIGLLGAVTNRSGNESEVDAPYSTFGELQQFAADRSRSNADQLFDIRTVTMFCAALRRSVWNQLGPLDERFEVGLFEDDDYSMRARQAGYRIVCAEDTFVHHFGQASIGKLGPTREYGPLFHANRERWESKWGLSWQPYVRRVKPAYRELIFDIRRVASAVLPDEATVLVLTKGDPELLNFDGRQAWHFPQEADGTYSGHHPADSAECIGGLEALRARGASHLLIPATMRWWLEYYEGFQQHLHAHYRFIADQAECMIVDLSETGDAG